MCATISQFCSTVKFQSVYSPLLKAFKLIFTWYKVRNGKASGTPRHFEKFLHIFCVCYHNLPYNS